MKYQDLKMCLLILLCMKRSHQLYIGVRNNVSYAHDTVTYEFLTSMEHGHVMIMVHVRFGIKHNILFFHFHISFRSELGKNMTK